MPRGPRYHDFKVNAFYDASAFTVGDMPIFTDEGIQEYTKDLLSRVAFFSNVQIFNFILEPTHFHIIFGVVEDPDLKEEKGVILERIKALYKPEEAACIEGAWAEIESMGSEHMEKELNRWRVRMNNYSMFMKTFLQRLTQNYNAMHERKGTLWRERYSCVNCTTEEALALTTKYVLWNPQRRAYNLVADKIEKCKELQANPALSLEDLKKVQCEINRLQTEKEGLEEACCKAGVPLAFLEYNPPFTCSKFLGSRERLLQLIGDRPYLIHPVLNDLYCVGGWAVKVKKRVEKRE